MSENKPHDLHAYIQGNITDMAEEYDRIQKRASEDPGTAGDQGEENWAELLREWLPRTYEVVTKGQIIGHDGCTSPQIDVLVLKSIYPEKLLNKKLYLAAGVAAAFECKTTLKAEHIEKAAKTCVKIKNLYSIRSGTPYKELHAPIIYGLLAHSHSWKGTNSTPKDNVRHKLLTSDLSYVTHPREHLDLICVADLAIWTSFKEALHRFIRSHDLGDGLVSTNYIERDTINSTPIGDLISYLSRRIAWEVPELREISNYYWYSGVTSGGKSQRARLWDNSIYSDEVRDHIQHGRLSGTTISEWNEWQDTFHFP